jgi:uncharacterized membrane protein SpoIIM required for sporulation
MIHRRKNKESLQGGSWLKKSTKWVLWILGFMLAAIFINFFMNLFSFAYALITVLLLALMGWGFVIKLKNDVRQYEDHYRRESHSEINDIERYTR